MHQSPSFRYALAAFPLLPSSRCILPLSLSRQAKVFARHLIQFWKKTINNVIITHTISWMVGSFSKPAFPLTITSHDFFPQGLSHHGLTNVERVQLHAMYRAFVIIGFIIVVLPVRVSLLRSHPKCATFDGRIPTCLPYCSISFSRSALRRDFRLLNCFFLGILDFDFICAFETIERLIIGFNSFNTP